VRSGPKIKGGGPQVKGGKAQKINTAEFFQDKKKTPPRQNFRLGFTIPRGNWVNYLENNFELDIRNPGSDRKILPEAFATALVESPGL
jgi:hypothetical protein